jgi:hypothetical protein
MTLELNYEQLGTSGLRYAVRPARQMAVAVPSAPVVLSVGAEGAHFFQDYLSSAEARRLAFALIDQANKADVRRGKAGVHPNPVARAEAA